MPLQVPILGTSPEQQAWKKKNKKVQRVVEQIFTKGA